MVQPKKPTLKELLEKYVPIAIFYQAFLGTLGSLYYSTFGDPVANLSSGNLFPPNSGFVPCELCWFARILMYPMVFISIVGILKNDKKFVDYILPLSIMGIFLEIYHYSIQKFDIKTIYQCTSANPCNAMEVNYLGFITIPFLGLIAFTLITVLSLWYRKQVVTNNE